MTTLHDIEQRADDYGLVIRGGFSVSPDDLVPDISSQVDSRTLVLFGNAGSSIWPEFSASPEFADGSSDPLDRWSERIATALADEWNGLALFPFGGPPFQPFLRWAKKAEQLESSRLGMLIHPQYGLWHAYRFAIALDQVIAGLTIEKPKQEVACDTCSDQPCLAGCPVDAFTKDGYDVERCFGFLSDNPDAACHTAGCQARRACPQGGIWGYDNDHAAFHMAKFYQSLSTRYRP